MSKRTVLASVAVLLASSATAAGAAVVSVATPDRTVTVGETFEVDVAFDGEGTDFLSDAAFDLGYDDDLFGFVGAEAGDELSLEGDPDFIGSPDEPVDLVVDATRPGLLSTNVASFNSSNFLEANQADDFAIVSFTFEALTEGEGTLGLAALGDFFADFFGEPIDVALGDDSVTVNVVGDVIPLPGAALFMASGLAGLALRRARRAA